ncbi:MAG: MopE-related protein [Myxococcota bacterium]
MLRWTLIPVFWVACTGELVTDDPSGRMGPDNLDDPVAPTVAFVTPAEGAEVAFDSALRIEIRVTDPDADDLQATALSWSGSYADEGPTVPDSSGIAVFFPADLTEGANALTVTATDDDGLTGTASLTFTVLPAPVDTDGDGFLSDVDCDDRDDLVFPGADEICDGIDQDCDGAIDEGVTTVFFEDRDGDGFGDAGSTAEACVAPVGFTLDASDCDDLQDTVFPGAPETCDGIDQDCDTIADNGVTLTFYEDFDGDGFGNLLSPTQACIAPAGFTTDASDCDDLVDTTFPGATETCDGVDQDCDSVPDDGVTITFYEDFDNDGFGNPAVTIEACTLPAGYAQAPDDCDDTDDSVTLGQIATRDPLPGAIDVALDAPVTVVLDSPDPNGLVSLSGPNGPVFGSSFVLGSTLEFVPDADLDPLQTYTVDVTWQCGTDQWTFTTENAPGTINEQLLLGRSYRLELDQGTVVQPAGAGALLNQLLTGSEILVGAIQAAPTSLDLRFGGAAAVGQELCTETTDVSPVDFTNNPTFELATTLLVIDVAGSPVPFEDLVIDGTFASTLGSVLTSFDGRLDTRDYSTQNFGFPSAACLTLGGFGVSCTSCADGQNLCVELEIADIPGQSEPTPLVSRTAQDIMNDPSCP